MELEFLKTDFTVCKVESLDALALQSRFCFVGRTDTELSLVCPTEDAPDETLAREDGWCGFRITGQLDFSLIGILADIASTLAKAGVSIFAVSTYDTDYVLIKREKLDAATAALKNAGYTGLNV